MPRAPPGGRHEAAGGSRGERFRLQLDGEREATPAQKAGASARRESCPLSDRAHSSPVPAAWLRALLPSLLLLVLLPGAARAAEDPAAPVERLHAALLDVMQHADALGFEGRRERLDPVIRSVFDLPFISRIALGRHWGELSEDQRARMLDAFTRYTVSTYASRFDGWSGQAFHTLGTQSLDSDRAVVRTELRAGDGEPTQLDYMLQRDGRQWRIVNVIADGVSDLALKRAEYSSIIRREGFDALIAKIEEKTADYARKPGD